MQKAAETVQQRSSFYPQITHIYRSFTVVTLTVTMVRRAEK